MDTYVRLGDGIETIEGIKAKSQTMIITGEYEYSTVYGDAKELIQGAKGGNDSIYCITSPLNEGLIDGNLIFADAFQLIESDGGNDAVFGGNFVYRNDIFGDGFEMIGCQGGNDRLAGGADVYINVLYGDGFMMVNSITHDGQTRISRGGNDVLIAGNQNSNNRLFGDCEDMSGGVGGNDILIGGGAGTRNSLIGDGTRALEASKGGNDVLISGEGDDTMWGDFRLVSLPDTVFGHDTFVFKSNNGTDRIYDFRSGEDKIEFSGMSGIDDFSDLTISFSSAGTQLTFADRGTISLVGVANVQAQDFIFS